MTSSPSVWNRALSRIVREETVFIWVVSIWLFTVFYFDPRILALLSTKANLIGKLSVIAFVLCLNYLWFLTIYFIVVIVVSNWLRRRDPADLTPPAAIMFPNVAVLYPTRNDFREDAVENLLKLDYPNFKLFILDDSTLDGYRRRADEWAAGHAGRVVVIRRETHAGFKAGNVNHAMRIVGNDFPYFAVCDNDGFFPRNFIRDLLPYFEADPELAFVQTAQRANQDQTEYFAQAMGANVAIHFRHYVRARQSYGFVMFYGHGALMKTAVWQEAGGLPEIVTEDLSYSSIVRTLGYHGRYTEAVVCGEDFPPTYAQLRRRTEKWIRGTAEFLKLYYRKFWESTKVPWFEKLDVLLHATTHFTAVPTLIFLLVLGVFLPASYDFFRYPGSFFFMPVPEGKTAFSYLVNVKYHIFWSWDFYIMMMLTVFLPTIPVMYDLRKQPGKMIRFVVAANFVYLAGLLVETLSLIAFLVTGKAFFRNTHDASEPKRFYLRDIAAGFHANHPLVYVGEIILGAGFLFLCWRNKNLWFSVPGTALLLSPLMRWVGWENRWIRILIWVPFLIGIFILGLVTMDVFSQTFIKICKAF